MNLKYLALLLLFVVNVCATAVADSSHVDFPEVGQECQHDCHVTKKAEKKQSDSHENHPDCCHENHVHYYVILPQLKQVHSSSVAYVDYPLYIRNFRSNILEIIKPPLV